MTLDFSKATRMHRPALGLHDHSYPLFGGSSPGIDAEATSTQSMDLSDVAVRHAVAFTALNIKHSVDFSPSTLSFAKEIRYCVIAIVTGATIASVVRSVLESRRSSTPTLP